MTNAGGQSLFLLLGDHAGNLVPQALGRLGLAQIDLQRHIALDLGIAELGGRLAALLDTPFVEQRYSRLVIDCNRAPESADSIAPASDGTAIPANATLDPAARLNRRAAIFDPYHDAIAELLERGREAALVSLHSFTPALGEEARPWDIGVLYDGGDTGLAKRFLARLQAAGEWCVGDNRPYTMDDTDFTIPRHAYPRALPYVEIEVRQDRLGDADGVAAMARAIGDALLAAAGMTVSRPG
jgi:predicted N-formylglutamate amidohydrolase